MMMDKLLSDRLVKLQDLQIKTRISSLIQIKVKNSQSIAMNLDKNLIMHNKYVYSNLSKFVGI